MLITFQFYMIIEMLPAINYHCILSFLANTVSFPSHICQFSLRVWARYGSPFIIKLWIVSHAEAPICPALIKRGIVYTDWLAFNDAINIESIMKSDSHRMVYDHQLWNSIEVHVLKEEWRVDGQVFVRLPVLMVVCIYNLVVILLK